MVDLQADEKPAPTVRPWTLDEARLQLRLYPRDAYLQYVVLQLARRGHRLDEVSREFNRLLGGRGRWETERVAGVDLFSLFSGALAVQESLQLDTMRGQPAGTPRGLPEIDRPADAAQPAAPRIQVATLAGPSIQSHPWEKMLAGRQPEISPLARCVPADFYFAEFRSLGKLLELNDTSDLWGRHLFSQAQQEARSQLVGSRVQRQLAVQTHELLRPFYDLVIQEVAVTGSDLFLREGSDLTLLFRFRQPEVFRAQMELFLVQAAQSQPEARRREGEYLGVPYVELTSPDRAVHVFCAYPQPDLHVRSNSRVALERVIEAIRGRNAAGQAVTRLGDTTEFAYIRTLLPRGAAEEDGFVYLSDPFIRRLVGPELKLTERRRMLCYNHLRMIGHAALLHQTQQGRPPTSLPELAQTECSPGEFGQGDLACPDGGKYALAADGLSGICSHHGRAAWLTPCCEIPLQAVTPSEAAQYESFLQRYNEYWRTFFDPIAVRIQMTPQRYRLETIVLPLIDNSIYTGLARATSGPPQPLDALPIPKRNIFSVAVRLNKAELARQFHLESLLQESAPEEATPVYRDLAAAVAAFRQLGLAWHNYHDVHRHFPTAVSFDTEGQKTRLSWRVHLLPYLEQNELYSQFHLDEPWDSAHNRQLIARMPAVYRPINVKLAAEGKTRLVAPVGAATLMPGSSKEVGFADVTDGSSNTIMLVETDDEHAVVWTKPDDLEIDLSKPLAGLAVRLPGGVLVLMADGAAQFLRTSIAPDTLAALFTRDGGEPVAIRPADQIALPSPGRESTPFDLSERDLRRLRVGELLTKGVGDQIALHVCDGDPLFAFSLPSFLGMSLGSFRGGRGVLGGDETLWIGLLISALNSPVYVSVPVRDAKAVDEFLVRLDSFLAALARQEDWFEGFFRLDPDYYVMPLGETHARSYGLQFGPIKWRFFWARIGDGLYVASQPFILEDLAAQQAGPSAPRDPAGESTAHALVRMRPRHWQQVLSSYRLGWAENQREACLHNVGPLSSLVRAFGAPVQGKSTEQVHAELVARGAACYDAHFFCPDGGRYVLSEDRQSVICAVRPPPRASPRPRRRPATSAECSPASRT
jgi:hypothetical protein